MDIGKKIKHLRLINNMTQEDVASQLFISRQVISKWELGKSLPDLTNLLALSNLFNVSIDSLLKEDSNLQNQIIKQSNYKRYLLIASLYIYSLITIVVIFYCLIAFLLIPKDIKTSDLKVINSHFYQESTVVFNISNFPCLSTVNMTLLLRLSVPPMLVSLGLEYMARTAIS
ncbi:transcriptional regulator with XRE-family HTH domain [Bacillus sp. RC240]